MKRPYLVTLSLIDDSCWQDLSSIVIASNKKEAIKLADTQERRFSPDWGVSAKRITSTKKGIIAEFIE